MFAIDWQFPVHFSKCHTNSYYSEKYFIGTLFTRDSLGAYINSVTSTFVLLFIWSPYFFNKTGRKACTFTVCLL